MYLSLSFSIWKAETSDIHSLTNKTKPSCIWVLEKFGFWPSLQWVPFFALSPKLSFALDLTTWNEIRLSEMSGMSSVGGQPEPLALAALTRWMLLQPHWEAEGRGFYWSWIEQWGKAWALKPDRAGCKIPTLLSINCALRQVSLLLASVCKMGMYHLPPRVVIRIREDNIYTQCLTLNRSPITWFSFPSCSRFTKASWELRFKGMPQTTL